MPRARSIIKNSALSCASLACSFSGVAAFRRMQAGLQKLAQGKRKARERGLIRQIEFERRHRYFIMRQGFKVGPLSWRRTPARERNPIIRNAAPIGPLVDNGRLRV